MEQEPECVQVLEEVGPVLLELGQTDVALKVLIYHIIPNILNITPCLDYYSV